jgi:SlyX protein
MTEHEPRLVDLELRFMKLERFAHELSDVVAAQGRTIDMLTAETKRLRAQLSDDEGGQPLNEKPPHY